MLRETPRFVWATLEGFMAHRCPSMAAALSFYTFFSLPPLLLLLMVLLGFVLDPAVIQEAVAVQARSLVGASASEQVVDVLQHVSEDVDRGAGLSFLSGTALAFGATAAFAELQASFNRIWSVELDPDRGDIRNFLVKRVFSFGLVLAVGFLLLVSLVLSAALAAVGGSLAALLPELITERFLFAFDLFISLVIVTLLFATMFQVIPDARVAWRDVWPGAAVAAVLFVAGKGAIGLWLGSTDPGGAYGAAGSLAILLLWVYYTAMIVLMGAEVTRLWEERYGQGFRPVPGAVEVVVEKRKGAEG
jgi:membrane protein